MAEDKKELEQEVSINLQPGHTVDPDNAPSVTTDAAEQAPSPAPAPTQVEDSQGPQDAVGEQSPAQPEPESVEEAVPAETPEPPAPGADPVAEEAEEPPPQDQNAPATEAEGADNEINWTASEFVHHEKGGSWYLGLLLVAFAVAAVVYLLTRDLISASVLPVCALFLAVLAKRRPRQLEYRLDSNGVGIGDRYQEFHDFRSFSVLPEGGLSSIVFMPLKRFAPHTTIFYDPGDEDKIVNLLTKHLPFEEYKPDAVERAMRRIRY